MPRVLVVDDNRPSRELIGDILRPLGLEVAEAENGIAGLAAARRLKPDLLILDIAMPGMDGFGVLRELRRDPAFSRTPVIAVTANAAPGGRAQALAAGFHDFITKPLHSADLRRRVEACLSGPNV